MPQRLNVVRLDTTEKEALADAVQGHRNDSVAREVKTALKQSADAVTAASKSADLDAGTLRAAQQSLNDRVRLLEALPTGEAQQEALQSAKNAIGLVDEALGLVDG